jgi:hypothetical protein
LYEIRKNEKNLLGFSLVFWDTTNKRSILSQPVIVMINRTQNRCRKEIFIS